MIAKNNENFLEEKSQNSWSVKPRCRRVSELCPELGFPGAPWPSGHCPTCLSSCSGHAAGEGAWRGRGCITTKLHDRLIYIISFLLSRECFLVYNQQWGNGLSVPDLINVHEAILSWSTPFPISILNTVFNHKESKDPISDSLLFESSKDCVSVLIHTSQHIILT